HIDALDPLGDQVAGQRLDALDGDVALFVVAGIEGGDDALVFGRIFHDKTLQSLGGRGAQPLTAPMVMPWVKYFWNMRKTATMGMAASAAPAMMRPKSDETSPCRRAIPVEMVSTSRRCSMISCRK